MDFTVMTSFFEQKTTMEFLRLGIVYVHLIACCVAIGMVLTSDFALIRELLRGEKSHLQDTRHMQNLQSTVSNALLLLWLTGIALIWLDVSSNGLSYLLNPKLQVKVAIVMLLTFNGMVLHHWVLPALQKAGSLLNVQFSMRMLALFTGALSGVSWFYAAMLGVGRPLAWKYSVVELMAAYPVLILGGFLLMALLTQWAKQREETPTSVSYSYAMGNAALAGR
ncbi:hypothetical protein [Pseudomonas sp.]|uniref:hypothetical protein n=1 Tax=Pseudomonas sp. TaxID=306 RepID=UPI003D10F1D5